MSSACARAGPMALAGLSAPPAWQPAAPVGQTAAVAEPSAPFIVPPTAAGTVFRCWVMAGFLVGEKTGGVGQPKVRPFATPPVRKKRAAHQKSPPPVQPAAVTARPGADGRAGWLGLDGPADWPHGGDGREAVEKPP